MDAQDDVTNCFEYSKCNLNAKMDRSNVTEMQRTQKASNSLKSRCKTTYLWDLN